jgi:hypothetical protein
MEVTTHLPVVAVADIADVEVMVIPVIVETIDNKIIIYSNIYLF